MVRASTTGRLRRPALLFGGGDLAETLRIAFNFGWDADNSAATAGTIVGVVKGYRWLLSQEWQIVDRYKNTSRQNMPNDEKIIWIVLYFSIRFQFLLRLPRVILASHLK